MALLSLLPAIGAGLVWGPVALYFLATGSVWQGVLLAGYGVLVIGLVDNIAPDTGRQGYEDARLRYLDHYAWWARRVGLVGFVVGPVIAALFIAVWEVVAGLARTRATRPLELAHERQERKRQLVGVDCLVSLGLAAIGTKPELGGVRSVGDAFKQPNAGMLIPRGVRQRPSAHGDINVLLPANSANSTSNKIDYVLCSPSLFDKMVGGGASSPRGVGR